MVWARVSRYAVAGGRTRRAGRGTFLVLAVTVPVLLAGCGGQKSDDAAASTPTASPNGPATSAAAASSPTASATPSPTGTQGRPAVPPARDTAAARQRFTRFVVDAWGYALRTDDPRPVTRLSTPGHPCIGCHDLTATLAQRKKQHWYVAFPGAEVHRLTVRPTGAPKTWVGTAVVDIPASTSYFDDGSYRNTNAAHPKASFSVVIRLEGKRGHLHYRLLGFSVG